MNKVFTPPYKPAAKNVTAEFLRFCFTCIICVVHCNAVAPFVKHGYIAVEFFFVLSGYLLYHSFTRHRDIGVLDFTLRKVKRFFVPFVLSMLLLMVLDRKQYLMPAEWTPDGILTTYFSHLHEFFFLRGVGLTRLLPINGPMWYLSVLLIGGALLYALLRNNRNKAITLYIPFVCIFGLAYVYNAEHDFIPGINRSLMRGLSEMSLGVLIAVLMERKKQAIARRAGWFDLMGIVAFCGFTLMILAEGNYDYLSVVLVPLMLIAIMTPECRAARMVHSKIWLHLGGLSLYMYIIHQAIAALYYIMVGHLPAIGELPTVVLLPCYLTVVVLSALILKRISQRINQHI